MENSKKILIIGGGISGLSTAWFLYKKGIPFKILESQDRVGGTIKTSLNDGFRIEEGPNSTLQKAGHPEDALGRIIEGAGLGESLTVADPSAAIRYIVRNGELRALPTSPLSLLTSNAFSLRGKLRLLAEPFIARGIKEETISEFVRRRLGQEFLDYAIEPFISGVYAGDPKELSVRAAVSKIYALEKEYGSLIKGAMAKGKAMKSAGMPKGRMVSFADGMETLPKGVAEKLPHDSIITGTNISKIEKDNDGWKAFFTKNGTESVESGAILILAIPTRPAAKLLAPLSKNTSDILESIKYAPIAVVTLGFSREDISHSLGGFGFLIPRKEDIQTLGSLFSTTLFKNRASDNKALITSFIGGTMNESIMGNDDEAILNQVSNDISPLLGVSGEPVFTNITRYNKGAIAQYELGHLEKIKALDKSVADLGNLYFRANWRDGVSVADCARNGELLAEEIIK